MEPGGPSVSRGLAVLKGAPFYLPLFTFPACSRSSWVGGSRLNSQWGAEAAGIQAAARMGSMAKLRARGSVGYWLRSFSNGITICKEAASSVQDLWHLALWAGKGVP